MSDEEKPPPPVRHISADMLPEPLRHVYQMLEQLTEHIHTSDAETQRRFDFIIEQQAQLTATVGQLAVKVDRTANSTADLLAAAVLQADEIKDLGESVRAIDERQRAADERARNTDERLNVLVGVVERIISERRDGV